MSSKTKDIADILLPDHRGEFDSACDRSDVLPAFQTLHPNNSNSRSSLQVQVVLFANPLSDQVAALGSKAEGTVDRRGFV